MSVYGFNKSPKWFVGLFKSHRQKCYVSADNFTKYAKQNFIHFIILHNLKRDDQSN